MKLFVAILIVNQDPRIPMNVNKLTVTFENFLNDFLIVTHGTQGSFSNLLVTLSFRTFSTHYDRQLSSWTFSMHYDRYTDECTHVQKIMWSDDQKSDTLKVTLTFQCNPIALDLFEYSCCAWYWKTWLRLRRNRFC